MRSSYTETIFLEEPVKSKHASIRSMWMDVCSEAMGWSSDKEAWPPSHKATSRHLVGRNH